MSIFDIFSKRDKPLPDVYQTTSLPQELRVQIVKILQDAFGHLNRRDAWDGSSNEAMRFIREAICREKGRFFLYEKRMPPEEDLLNAILASQDIALVIDIVDFAFKYMAKANDYRLEDTRSDWIAELNHRFREHGVGYQFDEQATHLFAIDNELVHQQVIRRTLKLLADPR